MSSGKYFKQYCRKAGLLFLLAAASYAAASAQDKPTIEFGSVKGADFTTASPVVDSGANAVIVLDKGDISFEGNEVGWFRYVFKRSMRIKVINKNAFDFATVKIGLYQKGERKEIMEKVSGTTYNYENGKIIETKLDAKDVFEEKHDKNHFAKKFTMPAVKEGSIIEYSYTIKSDFTFNLPEWSFQSTDAPTLWSELNVVIPNMLSYIIFRQGYHDYHINKGGETTKSYFIRQKRTSGSYASPTDESYTVSTPAITHRWVMKDLPAMNEGSFISSSSNLVDEISFQLFRTYNGDSFENEYTTWGKTAEELTHWENFGRALEEDNFWLEKIINDVVNADDDLLVAAKKIFHYVQQNYNCTESRNPYLLTNLRDVVKKKSGSVGDINLLMIALLKQRKINSAPVLLSTRENGRNPESFPMLERLNYVVAKATIYSKVYYLDAASGFLPFGKLPQKVYNGHARVISTTDTSAVYFEPDSVKESRMINLVIINNDKNEVVGSYTNSMGFFESVAAKNKVLNTGLKNYETEFTKSFSDDIGISNLKIDSIARVEEPVTIKFDFQLKSFGDADIVYFNPMLDNVVKVNPFTAAQRVYPVEMPYTVDDIYVMNMVIPKGYVVEELPKSTRINLNEEEGMFEYLLSQVNGSLQMRCRLRLKKATFTSEDYQTLRDFYAFVVKKEAEQIVFKKIK